MKDYELLFLDRVIGSVSVKKIGLYTEFNCLCKLPKGRFLRVLADYNGEVISLGICVWENNQYRCVRKIPSKHLGQGSPEFRVIDAEKDAQLWDYSIVDTQKPFAEIKRLPYGRLLTEQGIIKVLFVDLPS